MGVYLRKNGWCYEIRARVNGKQIMLDSRYGYETQDAATLEWIAAKAKIKNRQTHTTFRDACTSRLRHLEDYSTKEAHEKFSASFTSNRGRLGRFTAAWGDLPIEDITRGMVKARLRELVKVEELTPANANKHMIALKAVFNHMIKEGKLGISPCQGIPFFPTSAKVKFIPEKDQMAQVLLLAKPLDRAYLTVIAYSAARVGEVNKLTWEDVNFERASIRVWTRKKSGGTRTPRWVPVNARVMDAIRYAHQHRAKNSPWVFTNPAMMDKYPDNPARWRYIYRDKFFKTLCRKAGVPEMGYHALRHRAASNMMAKGASLIDVQHLLGHERATTTDLYLQSLGFNALRGAAELMDDDEEAQPGRDREVGE